MRRNILYFAIKYNGNYKQILKAIQEKEFVSEKDLENVENKINGGVPIPFKNKG